MINLASIAMNTARFMRGYFFIFPVVRKRKKHPIFVHFSRYTQFYLDSFSSTVDLSIKPYDICVPTRLIWERT